MPSPRPPAAEENAFLQAACDGDQPTALRLLAEQPGLATSSVCVASMLGESKLVQVLIEQDRGLVTKRGGPKDAEPLLYASFSRFHLHDSKRRDGIVQVAKLLLAKGGNPNAFTFWEFHPKAKLPALWAATSEANHPALARVLLEAGADPNDGESIYHAAERHHTECLELLLAFGANLSGPHASWGNTPLYFLLGHQPPSEQAKQAKSGIRWLLEHGADPNVPSYSMEARPVHRAIENGWGSEMLEWLRQHGADLRARRKDGKTAYALASRLGRAEDVSWLRAHEASAELSPVDEFFAACMGANEPAVRLILQRQPDFIPSLSLEERRLLVECAAQVRSKAISLMLTAGIPIDTLGCGGETALHMAAWFGNLENVQVLLGGKAPLEIEDKNYHATPLGWACHGSENCPRPGGDYPSVVEALLAAGAGTRAGMCGSEAVNNVLRRFDSKGG